MDSVGPHTHQIVIPEGPSGTSENDGKYYDSTGTKGNGSAGGGQQPIASSTPATKETRPKNVSVNYIIKL